MTRGGTPRSGGARPQRPASLPRATPPSRPARVRVTNPRMGTTTRPTARSPASEIDEQTYLGAVYMRSLIRVQLRQASLLIVVLMLLLIALPVVFAWQPALSDVRIVGVPLPWLLLGAGTYPLMSLAALWLVRAADRAERDFGEMVDRP